MLESAAADPVFALCLFLADYRAVLTRALLRESQWKLLLHVAANCCADRAPELWCRHALPLQAAMHADG
jgi:hypothetical protein